MANYENLELIVWYNGTLSSFKAGMFQSVNGVDQLQQNDKTRSYADKIVFITGTTATGSEVTTSDKVQAIWVSQTRENGTIEGKFLNMSDVSTLAAQLSYIDGLAIESTDGVSTSRIPYDITGGKSFLLAGENGINISLYPERAVDINGKPYWRIKVDAGNLKTQIEAAATVANDAKSKASTAASNIDTMWGVKANVSTNDSNKSIRTIAGEEAGKLVGTAEDLALNPTINGAKNYAKALVDGLSDDNIFVKPSEIFDQGTDKIKASLLPDVILGQLMYGGIIGDKANNIEGTPANITISPSGLFTGAFGEDVPKENLTSVTFLAENYRNVYFIVGNPNPSNAVSRISFDWDDVNYQLGDWLLSDGEKWTKIDNTDAVSSVADLTGVITTGALADKLATAAGGYTDPLAKKSDIKIDSIQARASVDDVTKQYFSVSDPDGNKDVSFSAEVKTMGKIEADTNAEGFADARDVYNFIKARLSIKVVNSENN